MDLLRALKGYPRYPVNPSFCSPKSKPSSEDGQAACFDLIHVTSKGEEKPAWRGHQTSLQSNAPVPGISICRMPRLLMHCIPVSFHPKSVNYIP